MKVRNAKKCSYWAKILLFCFISIMSFSSCLDKKKRVVVAKIGEEEIEASTINRLIDKDLYEYFYRIYEIRSVATQEYIGLVLLKKAAEENNISIDSVLASYVKMHNYLNVDEDYLRQQLIDSLFVRYDVKIMLEEPIAPLMRIDQALTHARGYEESPITITELSDFDCGMCSYMHKEYLSLYEKYGNRVKFVHSTFSSEVSPSARAAQAASLQDKYWEMSDTLFALPIAADSLTVMNIAMQMELDIDQFIADYTSTENIELLAQNNEYLSNCGVVQTPTILLNGHPLRKPNSVDYIASQIERALNEAN